jgi:membrane protease YdiL (CAAX protease family)
LRGEVELPMNRETRWRTVFTLVLMQFLGNLAAIPLNYSSVNGFTEPLTDWVLWTLISIPVIWVAVSISAKVGLGTPLIEGYVPKRNRPAWVREVLSFTVICILVTLPLYLLINSGITQSTYPQGWQLVLASVQAGVREEVFSRLLLMSLFVWIWSRIKKEAGRPSPRIVWVGNIFSAIIFGFGHIDNVSTSAELLMPFLGVFGVNAFLGLFFGWLFWRYGLEAAILSHFIFDAFGSAVVIPVYLWSNITLRIILTSALIICGLVSLNLLRCNRGV